METEWNSIELMAKEIKSALADFLLNHSRIEPPRYEEVAFFLPEGNRSYAFLDDAGRKVQSDLKKSYDRYSAALRPLLEGQPDDVSSKMSKLDEVVRRTIDHKLTWCENTRQALDLALEALEGQVKLARGIHEENIRKD